ncbi:MAG: HD domain-containing protein [Clostridia bacterium]|nr:HD domain-containing protein [Clostridia bacterium]
MKLLSNYINNQQNQVEGFCLIKNVSIKVNKNGADYLDFTLEDAEGEVNAKLWDYQSAAHGTYSAGEIIKVRGSVSVYNNSEQLRVERIRKMRDGDEVDISSIVAESPVNGELLYKELYDFAGTFFDPDIASLTRYLLAANKDRLIKYPAALRLHHAHKGGLMLHTHTMLGVARKMIEVYSGIYAELSSDLVYAGVILHDIAKTAELDVSTLGLATAYTTEGQLLGHITMGVNMIETAAAELGIPNEKTMLLAHILLSHHGMAEFGSPKFPMFPEAEIVSAVDTLDAKLFEMFDALGAVQIGAFTDRQWALDNRQLFRHGHGIVSKDGGAARIKTFREPR